MIRTFWVGVLGWAIVTAPVGQSLAASPDAPASVVRADAKTPRGRLPSYYAQVVTQEQREAIYKIQAEFAPKIQALDLQLKAIKAERDKKVLAVLTPEQRKLVEETAAKAKAGRANRRAEQAEAAKKSELRQTAEKASKTLGK